jgi:hypothetical protein
MVNGFTLQEQVELLQLHLRSELALGVWDAARLGDIEEKIRVRTVQLEAGSAADTTVKKFDIFDKPSQLFARYEHNISTLSLHEQSLRNRSAGISAYTQEIRRRDDERMNKLYQKDKRGKIVILDASLSAVPVSLRELVLKLPKSSSLAPDIDGFITNLRRIVLPPRPVEDFRSSASVQAQDSGADDSALDYDNRSDIFRIRKKLKLGKNVT